MTGHNGAGKSTLLAVLAGDLEPSTGGIRHHTAARVALVGQEVPAWEAELTAQELYDRHIRSLDLHHRIEPLPLTSTGCWRSNLNAHPSGDCRRGSSADFISRCSSLPAPQSSSATNHQPPIGIPGR
ncbi:ATP-binding cassette domain-containing protein [Rhodococcus hoagii]|nr:ATP-binding cassette domain-containing protein [Prescottella equi]